jgi:hypothetical protein
MISVIGEFFQPLENHIQMGYCWLIHCKSNKQITNNISFVNKHFRDKFEKWVFVVGLEVPTQNFQFENIILWCLC